MRPSPSLLAASVTLSSLTLALFAACSASSVADDGARDAGASTVPGSSGASGTSGTGSSGSSGASSGQPDAASDGAPPGLAPEVVAAASCSAPVPAGAALAAALPTYAGACPALAAAGAFTTIATAGGNREFLVYKPETIAPGETLPVVFLWHWLGGEPKDMARVLDVQAVVEQRRLVAVIPAPKDTALFRWPFEAQQPQSRVDEELKFFDDMLACVAAAVPVNKECVSSVGVSAGALWTAQLASQRSTRIASFVSLSGGVGGVVRGWSPATRAMPAVVLWGGPGDFFPEQFPIVNFESASKELEDALVKDGHFLVECIHNCGHTVPPLDEPPPGEPRFDLVWRFVLDHPYWLPKGQSPYATKPLPSPGFPAWCAAGPGKAVARPADAACP